MFTGELLAAIDERVLALAPTTDRAWGTVSYHSGSFYDRQAMVTLDGDTVALPMRVPGSVDATTGDRVICLKVGSLWTIAVSYTRRWPNEGVGINQVLTSGSTGSGTFATLPGSPSITLTKRWTETRLRTSLHVGCYANNTNTDVRFGMRFTRQGVVTEFHVDHFFHNAANVHAKTSSVHYASSLAAGDYTVEPLWARWSGLGSIVTDSSDWLSMSCREAAP